MARSHAVTGLAGWLLAAPLLHLPRFAPASLLLVLAGSLLPDIDHPGSWIGRRLRPVSTAIAGTFGHRGITHSALAAVALTALMSHGGSSRDATCAFAVGYLSHLAADLLSSAGLRLAWPSRGIWRIPLYQTGSTSELVVLTGICLLAGWLLGGGPDGHGLSYAVRPWLGRIRMW